MVEVPSGDHTITCTRLALPDGSHIFLRTKWFNTSFYVTVMDFPCSWSCHVSAEEVEDRASMLAISCEEFFSQARVFLGDGISDSQYSFEALGHRRNVVRLSWTIVDMRYTQQPRVTLFLQEDSSPMELVPEFLNVLMDMTLIVKDLLARRKMKSKKNRQLALQYSASKKIRKRSLSQEAPNKVEVLDGLVVEPEFPNRTSKLNLSPGSHEPASGLSTPMHPPDFKARVPQPKHSLESTARLYEHGLSSWAQPHTPIQTTTVGIDSRSKPATTFHGVEFEPQNAHNTLADDKAVLSHESPKPGMANSGSSGWINPRRSRIEVESRNFELSESKRHDASEGQDGVIMLSDSEEEDHHILEVDSGIPGDEDLLYSWLPRAMEGLVDGPENRLTMRAGHLNDSLLDAWRGNIEVPNMNVSMVEDERCRLRLESEAETSLGCRSKSQKRKDRDGANEERTGTFDEGKLMQWKEQVLTSGGSLLRDKIELDAQDFVPDGGDACIKVESEYRSETNAVLKSGDHPSTSNHLRGGQWSTWISEAITEVTSWEAQAQIGDSMTGGSDHVENQPPKNMEVTSSPCDPDRLVTSLSLMNLDRNLDAVDSPHTDAEYVQSPREILSVDRFPSEEKSSEECPEISDRGGFENPEISHTRELGKSKKEVSADVSELEKVKVERELIEGENVGDSVEEPGFEPGVHSDTEVMTGAGEFVVETLKFKQEEKPTSIRSLPGPKVPGRKGRPPGSKTKLHFIPKSVTQGANIYSGGTTQSNRDPRNTSLQRVSHTSRPVGRSKPSNSQGQPPANANQEQQKFVPDGDCYNFDDDRVKEKVKPNQVWALYHDIDTMPRYLIRVKEVSTTGAFWVKANWLQSHIPSQKNEQQKETLYPSTCGFFEELKETIVFKVINCFSHRMEFTTKLDKKIQVYPRKDEVWALYSKKDLTLNHSEKEKQGKQTKQNVNNFSNFRLLVILSNCEEGRPVDIWVLRKRIGYRTLWEPGYDKGSLPFKSLERFSHRVPAHKLTVEDYPDLNKSDIWDIDAAAVPECLGKVT